MKNLEPLTEQIKPEKFFLFLCLPPHFFFSSNMSTASNFLASASLAPVQNSSAVSAGQCSTNVDGVCISGGQRVSGSSGYELASLSSSGGQCYSAHLFASPFQPYVPMGWKVGTNAVQLKATPW